MQTFPNSVLATLSNLNTLVSSNFNGYAFLIFTFAIVNLYFYYYIRYSSKIIVPEFLLQKIENTFARAFYSTVGFMIVLKLINIFAYF